MWNIWHSIVFHDRFFYLAINFLPTLIWTPAIFALPRKFSCRAARLRNFSEISADVIAGEEQSVSNKFCSFSFLFLTREVSKTRLEAH